MWTRSTRMASGGIVSGMLGLTLIPGGASCAPLSLSQTVPVRAPGSQKGVVVAPAAVPVSPAQYRQSPSGNVRAMFVPRGPLITVCTTFPGAVSLDRRGNVYLAPTATDAQGRERAVGPPMPLAPAVKKVGGVTETGHT